MAEVVGFVRNVALLSPLGNMQGISPATEVIPTGEILSVPVGYELLGRVVDGLGQAMDGGPAIRTRTHYPLVAEAPNPMTRKVISKPISLGLRVIDGVLTCGEGQRMGIFAAAGGGKREVLGKRVSPQLEEVLESRRVYQRTEGQRLPVVDGSDRYLCAVAAPILSEGDLLGLVILAGQEPMIAVGDTEYKLAQTIAAFLGRHMES